MYDFEESVMHKLNVNQARVMIHRNMTNTLVHVSYIDNGSPRINLLETMRYGKSMRLRISIAQLTSDISAIHLQRAISYQPSSSSSGTPITCATTLISSKFCTTSTLIQKIYGMNRSLLRISFIEAGVRRYWSTIVKAGV